MTDDIVRSLAVKAGVDPVWRDQRGRENAVGMDTLRAVLGSIGLPCGTDDDARNSLSIVELGAHGTIGQRFLSARIGQPVTLPLAAASTSPIEVEMEGGAVRMVSSLDSQSGLLTLSAFEDPGYHRIRVAESEFEIAVAPVRCVSFADLCQGETAWGPAAQIYSLRRAGDGGIGDLRAAADLGVAAARRGADFLALSPIHALFSAEPGHYSPYSPSSRLVYNPDYAAPADVLPIDLIQSAVADAGLADALVGLEALDLIDWPEAGATRRRLLHALFERVSTLSASEPVLRDFERFRAQASESLRDHCTFEALHAYHLQGYQPVWSWRDWPEDLRAPGASGVVPFQREHGREIDFHLFCQWITGRSYGEAQRRCRDAGMRVGLVADLAIGMEPTGSHAWSRQQDVLAGVSIGAPPDNFNAEGQNWGLTNFSPRGLAATGFQPFIETLRAAMRHAGGVRIDHVMGLSRLWVIPNGAGATDGAYLHFPSETLFRLIALESWRHKAVVIGEDLGTLPDGFQPYLREQGVAGMRVMRFERDASGYRAPDHWDDQAVAMTTTHDLVSTAGWWQGSDLEGNDGESGQSASIRDWDRGVMWSAFERAGVAASPRPAPEDGARAVDATLAFIARTPCQARLVAVEDLLALTTQPNIPGTTSEKPNWRHRITGEASGLLEGAAVAGRLELLGARPRSAD